MSDQVARPGDISSAVSQILAMVREIEDDISSREDPHWVAENGPRLKTIQDANVIYYRDTDSVRTFNTMPKGDNFQYKKAAEAYLRLAATCLKIAIDFQTTRRAEEARFRKLMRAPKVTVGPEEDDDE